MSELPPLFFDLAVILMTAGVITVLFKWLKQPLVLGYIVAGFFIGPYFPWFPAITDDSNLHTWSDIGIVFLMFALGLEFSIRKLKKVGSTGAITAFTELIFMFLIGTIVGRILGWPGMDSIFLGCMLSISSTTIIIKSFDDLRLKQQKFTGTVTAVLVVEDLIAVLLLVVLNTISVSRHFDGAQLAVSLIKLVFSLVVWFTFGIYIIPSLLKMMRRHMTEETLCVVAVGLCFAMVVMAFFTESRASAGDAYSLVSSIESSASMLVPTFLSSGMILSASFSYAPASGMSSTAQVRLNTVWVLAMEPEFMVISQMPSSTPNFFNRKTPRNTSTVSHRLNMM